MADADKRGWNEARWIVAGWFLLFGLWPFVNTHEGDAGTMDLLVHAFGGVWLIWMLIPVVRRLLDE